MHKAASKALGFLVATCCFLTLFSPAAINVPVNSVDEIHAETAEEELEEKYLDEEEAVTKDENEAGEVLEPEGSEDSIITEDENSSKGDTDIEDESLMSADNVTDYIKFSQVSVLQQKNGEWEEVESKDQNWLLDQESDTTRLQLEFNKSSEYEWDKEQTYWLHLPELHNFSYQTRSGPLLVDDKDAGYFEFRESGPAVKNSEELSIDEAEKELTQNDSGNWILLSPDDKELFSEYDNFIIQLDIEVNNTDATAELLSFDKGDESQGFYLISIPDKENRTDDLWIIKSVTVEMDEAIDNSSFIDRKPKALVRSNITARDGNNTENDTDADTSENRFLHDPTEVQYIPKGETDYKPLSPNDNGVYIIEEGITGFQIITNYTLPANTLSENKNYVEFEFPEPFKTSEQSGDILQNGEVLGHYVVDKNGKMTLTFDEYEVQSNMNGSAIHGVITLAGFFDKSQMQDEKEKKYELNKNTSITIKYKKEIDLSINKTSSEIKDDNTVDYTISVNSSTGTSNSITITDTWNDLISSVDKIQVYLEPGHTLVTPDSQNVNPDDKTFTLNLPALEDSNSGYSITYTGKVVNDNLVGGKIQNTAVAKTKDSENNEIKVEKSHEKNLPPKITIKKEGKKEDNSDTYSWTIEIDSGTSSLAGWTLSDELNGVSLPESVSVYIKKENSADEKITLPYTFREGMSGKYIVTYTTTHQPEFGVDKISNTAKLDKGQDHTESTKDVSTSLPNPLKKSGMGAAKESQEDGTESLRLKWKVHVQSDLYSMPADWYITDEPVNSFFGKNEVLDLIAALKEANVGSFTAEFYPEAWTTENAKVIKSEDSNYSIDDNARYKKFKIVFHQELIKNHIVDFEYFTFTNDKSTIDQTTRYENKIWINEKWMDPAYNSVEKPKELTVEKTDATIDSSTNQGNSENTSHKLSDITKDGKIKIGWRIKTTIPSDWNQGKIQIEDIVPNGLELCKDEILANLGIYSHEQGLSLSWEESNKAIFLNDKSNPLPGIELQIDKQEDQSRILLTLTAEAIEQIKNHSGQDTEVLLYLPFEITDQKKWEFSESEKAYAGIYENQVVVKTEDNKP